MIYTHAYTQQAFQKANIFSGALPQSRELFHFTSMQRAASPLQSYPIVSADSCWKSIWLIFPSGTVVLILTQSKEKQPKNPTTTTTNLQKNPTQKKPQNIKHLQKNPMLIFFFFKLDYFFSFICASIQSGHFYSNKRQIATTCCIHLSAYLYEDRSVSSVFHGILMLQ